MLDIDNTLMDNDMNIIIPKTIKTSIIGFLLNTSFYIFILF